MTGPTPGATAASVRSAAESRSEDVKSAAALEGQGLLAYLSNVKPLADSVETHAKTFREFARQAGEEQPAPPSVVQGLELMASILASGSSDATDAWSDAQRLHGKDWDRAQNPIPNGEKGDVRRTMREV